MLVPRPYQEEGIDFLAYNPFNALWDEPGLGKTFQTLMAIKKRSLDDVLITCPASVRLAWKKECEKVGMDCRVILKDGQIGRGINIVSYEGASGRFYEEIMGKSFFQLLVNDEEHFLTGYNTRTIPHPHNKKKKIKVPTIRVEKIFGRHCDRRNCIGERVDGIWGLTGTPMPNHPAELYAMIRAKFPDAIFNYDEEPMSYWQFVNRYCKTRNNGFGMEILGGKNLDKLRDELRGRVKRRKKSEVADDLPSISYHLLPVDANLRDLPKEDLELLKECMDKPDPIKAMKRHGPAIASARRIMGMSKVKSVKKWIEESGHDKIVVFAHHKAVIDELRKIKGSVYIDGSCTSGQREKAVDAFQEGDAPVFIGQIQAAGTGLTLTRASVLVFIEYSWVPAENKQAAERIHRLGQNNNCLVFLATVPNSVDERIMEVVKKKIETYKELGL